MTSRRGIIILSDDEHISDLSIALDDIVRGKGKRIRNGKPAKFKDDDDVDSTFARNYCNLPASER